jgi:hypothetical protein
LVHAKKEPIFITKNVYGDLVVMSIETFDSMLENRELDAAIAEAEAEHTSDDQLKDEGKLCPKVLFMICMFIINAICSINLFEKD